MPVAEHRISLHRGQSEVFLSPARFKIAVCGRRWGKTTLGMAWLLARANKRCRLWYIAPTYRLAHDIIWRELLANIPLDWHRTRPNQTRLEFELVSGALIQLKGADNPDSLRGRGVDRVVMDEYADMPDIWAEVLMPSLVDTHGEALFLGTPKGFNHFHTLYKRGQDQAFPQWQSWRFPTWTAPHITAEELAEFRRTYQSHVYRQEFGAEFEARAGMVVGPLWEPTHTVTSAETELRARGYHEGQTIPWHVIEDPRWNPPPESNIYGSVDYGFGAPWSFHLHATLADQHVRTFYELYSPGVRDEDQARRIRRVLEDRHWRPDWIVMDPSMWNARTEMGLARSIAEVYEDELARPLGLHLMKGAAGRPARLSRPNRWMQALSVAPDGLPYWSCTSACMNLIRTVPEVPWDEDDPEVEDDDSENHCYEDVGRFFEARPVQPVKGVTSPYEHLDPISRAHHEARDKQAKKAHTLGKRGFEMP